MKISFYFLAVLLLPLSLAAVNSGRVHLHGSVNLNDAKIESGGKAVDPMTVKTSEFYRPAGGQAG